MNQQGDLVWPFSLKQSHAHAWHEAFFPFSIQNRIPSYQQKWTFLHPLKTLPSVSLCSVWAHHKLQLARWNQSHFQLCWLQVWAALHWLHHVPAESTTASCSPGHQQLPFHGVPQCRVWAHMWRQHENSLCYWGLLWARRLSYLKVPASLCLRKQVNSSFYLAFIGIIDVAIENTVINSIIILSENQNNLSKEQSESKHSNLADRLNTTITMERIYLANEEPTGLNLYI